MRRHRVVVAGLCAALAAIATAAPAPAAAPARSASKRVAGAINLHFVPHTHDDVGWLKTVDQYYLGLYNNIQSAGVQFILDSLMVALAENPERKFVYVEQAFFQRWWEEASAAQQATARQLVAAGQLEFVNGGWCMHDEANPDYVSMIDQTTLGNRWLAQEFGPQAVPRVTWQIDPFGHSAVQGSLMSSPLSGFGAVFWARISYDDRAARVANRSLEFIWQPSKSLGASATTFASTFRFHYSSPTCGDFDILNDNATPINDDPTLEEYNVDEVVACVAEDILTNYVPANRGEDVMVLFGDDFRYMNALQYFKSLDKLIKYINLNSGGAVNAFYSTPSAYLDAKLSSGIPFPLKTDDLFPYADTPYSYWSGYFTSRPALKAYIRESTVVQQAARQLQVLTGGAADLGPTNPLYTLERAIGVTQHHDAVSGTAKQLVTWDYQKRLAAGRAEAFEFMGAALSKLTNFPAGNYAACELANVTLCPPLDTSSSHVFVLYNSHAQPLHLMPVHVPITLPAGASSMRVQLPDGSAVSAQLTPLSSTDAMLRELYGATASSSSNMWLSFVMPAVPALGFASVLLSPASSADAAHAAQLVQPRAGLSVAREQGVGGLRGGAAAPHPRASDAVITNGIVSITFSGATGMMSSMTNVATGVAVSLSQEWYWYNASVGNNINSTQASGAYIFRPNGTTPLPMRTGAAQLTILTGSVVQEARIVVNEWVTQVVRLWPNATYAEVEYTVGPIDIADGLGKEVIARYSVPAWHTNATWYTDSNCRDMQTRIRYYRPTWTLNNTEPVAENYFPVNCAIRMQDASTGTALTVVTDRSQGGSSMLDGSLELMVHRRLLVDDSRGVNEALNETMWTGSGVGLITRGKHYLTLDTRGTAAASQVALQQRTLFKPLWLVTDVPASTWPPAFTPTFTGLRVPTLPPNVHLLTLHSQNETSLLVRLAHLYEVDAPPGLAANATVSLAQLLAQYSVTAVTELSLIANQAADAMPTFTYTIDTTTPPTSVTLPLLPAAPASPAWNVTLAPMQIRTFAVTIHPAGGEGGAGGVGGCVDN